jgi:DNA-binding XRE family transcriptional regulator
MIFASTLKAERERTGLSQEAAAELVEVSTQTWRNWENGLGLLNITAKGVIAALASVHSKTCTCEACMEKIRKEREAASK